MIYTLKIEGMEFRAAHGCYDTEQLVGGSFTVDVTLEVEDGGAATGEGGAAADDDVTRTVNYVEVYEVVREQMAVPSRIIENVAERILNAISACFPQILRAETTVAKLAPPIGGKAARVAVTFTR
ncbi:MAG: dihydroneopterin aldolase [Alistipes sp.]|jgi:dihydroneopterin aldolase|nr:dihydroneopterin aldolase [Alistipes sp.]